MTTTSLPPDDIDALVRQTVASLRRAVELRDQSYIRIGQRVTRIIRISMVVSGVVGLAILLIVAILTWQFREMVTAMAQINWHFGRVSRDVALLHSVIERMDQHVLNMPTIAAKVRELDSILAVVTADIATIQTSMGRVRYNLGQVRYNVVHMSHVFNTIDWSAFGISQDINTISQPVQNYNNMRSMFPMTPFP